MGSASDTELPGIDYMLEEPDSLFPLELHKEQFKKFFRQMPTIQKSEPIIKTLQQVPKEGELQTERNQLRSRYIEACSFVLGTCRLVAEQFIGASNDVSVNSCIEAYKLTLRTEDLPKKFVVWCIWEALACFWLQFLGSTITGHYRMMPVENFYETSLKQRLNEYLNKRNDIEAYRVPNQKWVELDYLAHGRPYGSQEVALQNEGGDDDEEERRGVVRQKRSWQPNSSFEPEGAFVYEKRPSGYQGGYNTDEERRHEQKDANVAKEMRGMDDAVWNEVEIEEGLGNISIKYVLDNEYGGAAGNYASFKEVAPEVLMRVHDIMVNSKRLRRIMQQTEMILSHRYDSYLMRQELQTFKPVNRMEHIDAFAPSVLMGANDEEANKERDRRAARRAAAKDGGLTNAGVSKPKSTRQTPAGADRTRSSARRPVQSVNGQDQTNESSLLSPRDGEAPNVSSNPDDETEAQNIDRVNRLFRVSDEMMKTSSDQRKRGRNDGDLPRNRVRDAPESQRLAVRRSVLDANQVQQECAEEVRKHMKELNLPIDGSESLEELLGKMRQHYQTNLQSADAKTELKEQLAKLQRRLTSLTRENEGLQSRVNERETMRTTQENAEMARIQRENDFLRGQLDEQNEAVATGQRETNQVIAKQQEELTSLQAVNDALRRQQEQWESDHQKLQQEQARLHALEAEKEAWGSEQQRLQSDLQEQKTQIERQQQELQAKIRSAQEQKDAADQRIDQLQQELAETRKTQNAEASEKSEAVESANRNLQMELEDAQQRAEEAETRNEVLEQRLQQQRQTQEQQENALREQQVELLE